MNFAKTYSAQINLLKGIIVSVETDLSRGLHSFSIVGLPDKAVDEAKDRVSSAIKNSGWKSPKAKNQKITISLSPADLRKEGPFFDLAIAVSYLSASSLMRFDPEGKIFLGELGLDGRLRPIRGVLPLVREAKEKGFRAIFLPKENASEAALIDDIEIYGAKNLKEVADHLSGFERMRAEEKKAVWKDCKYTEDLADIRGQESAKRGLEIAAAGGHNIVLYGPPGTGKTMLARSFAGILPELSMEESLEVTGIHSIAGLSTGEIISSPPFRSPHHTASYVSLVGGGPFPKPGEITLAHHGVLFMDEFPEFENRVLESLRQPLEEKTVAISRARGAAVFPCDFILIAAMNPCPCGNAFSKDLVCRCRPYEIERYKKKISGPIMDRIDLWVSVGKVDYEKLGRNAKEEGSEEVRKRVIRARMIEMRRSGKTNSKLDARELPVLSGEARKILNESAEKFSLSARSYHRVIKVSRTIADLAGSGDIGVSHILEALRYRPKIGS